MDDKDQIFAMFEPHLEERIDAAKEYARAIMTKQHKTMDDMILYLQITLAKHYGWGIYDPYFKDKTIDQLIFEVEVITMNTQSSPEVASALLKEGGKEAEGLFDDMVEADMKVAMSDDEWKTTAAKFMQTGEFTEESNDQ
jgi:hypothetical protein